MTAAPAPPAARDTAALSPAQRAYYEPRFGWSFAGVRVHAGGEAARLAAEHGAQALTAGRDIYLGAGRRAPELLAHELAHVVQQGSDPSLAGAVQCQPVAPAGPTPQWSKRKGGLVAASYLVNGIEFRIGITAPDLATYAQKIADIEPEITRANALIADPAMQVKFCVIAPSAVTHYATWQGKPALALDTPDVNAQTARHEMSHAVFASYHAAEGDPTSKHKDLSAVIAELHLRLAATKEVEDEELRTTGVREKATHPAGLWPFDPPQWSALPSEHPWDDPPDEFFASARAAFLTDKRALKKAIAKFTKIDRAVAKPAAELLTVLETLEKKKVPKAPRKVSAAARANLAALQPTRTIEATLGSMRAALVWALDPSHSAPTSPAPAPTPSTPPKTP